MVGIDNMGNRLRVNLTWFKNQSFIFMFQLALIFEEDALSILGAHNDTVEHFTCTLFVSSSIVQQYTDMCMCYRIMLWSLTKIQCVNQES